MHSRIRVLLPLCAAAVLSISFPRHSSAQQTNQGSEPKSSGTFVRLTESDNQASALQTAITRYENESGKITTVDLVGAVHIGEASYYETLNELFTDYDVVLYELVAPQGTRVPKGAAKRSTSNPLSFLQTSARQFLGLESQLEKVDYSVANFVHADLSPADLSAKMKERGDSPMSLAMGTIMEMMENREVASRDDSTGDELSLNDITEMMTDPLKAKRFMARQFGSSGMMERGLGEKLNQLIVADRNQAAMKVLDDEVGKGKQRVAIFYGAAHMPDFEERLVEKGFQRKSQSWITAWDLTKSSAPAEDHPMSLLMQLMKSMDQ